MKPEEILQLFHKTEALLEGHFVLASGLHSSRYFQCALVLQFPRYAERLGRAVADLFRGQRIDGVIGPALGGVVIAFEVARSLGARALYAERINGVIELRRGFRVEEGERILVVEDVITTGASAQEVVTLLREQSSVVGVASIVDRSSAPLSFEVPYRSLIKMEVQAYEPSTCPQCLEGIPLFKPGTRQNVL